MKRPASPLPAFLIYLLCRGLLGILALLPRRLGLLCGRLLGRTFYVASSRHRRIALRNLRRAFPDRIDAAGRSRIARAAFAHVGMICADAAYFQRLLRLPTESIAVYEGAEHLAAAAAQGRGVLIFSGHFGHWEMVALLQHRLGVPMAMVVRPLDNPRLDRLLSHLRTLSGNVLLPKRAAARGVLRALHDRLGVALLIDQNVRGEGGIFVDFFGAPASTTPSLATFALKSGAPVVPVFSYPQPDGRLRIVYRPALQPRRQGTLQEDIIAFTATCTRLLEDEVRSHPELWFWMHNRWRTRPPAGPAARPAGADAPPPALAATRRASPPFPGAGALRRRLTQEG